MDLEVLLVVHLTHWGRLMHISVSKLIIIASDNVLSPGRRQAIIWTNTGILIIRNKLHWYMWWIIMFALNPSKSDHFKWEQERVGTPNPSPSAPLHLTLLRWRPCKMALFLMIIQHWSRLWLGIEQVISHYMNQLGWSSIMLFGVSRLQWVNTLRPKQNGRLFADNIFKCIFLNENVGISINSSLKFVPKGPINNNPALVQIMAWRRQGDKPLSEPMMVCLLTDICVTRPQWVKARNTQSWIILSAIITETS